MVGKSLNPLEQVKDCISNYENFVLQGGAGSGKTQLLTETLEYIAQNLPDKKVLCITHTNNAADEIKSRVNCNYPISTIHSFLNTFIKNYKKNLHAIFEDLFKLDLMERLEVESYESETEQKKAEHAKYKKLYAKYSDLIFLLENKRSEKVVGKREYDKNPVEFNNELNKKIDQLNSNLSEYVNSKDYNQIHYTDTKFNRLLELGYGHDGLLEITAIIFEKYPLSVKILQDQFDCIFIDEYQDTNKKIIDLLLNKVSNKNKTIVGLYGDSMQAIYSDGIGDVESYIEAGKLKKINKEDNFRCSEQVVNFINQIRTDDLKQEVAYKIHKDGSNEGLEDRQGSVEFVYSIVNDKPHSQSSIDKREKYTGHIEKVIKKSIDSNTNYKALKLTNKSIASDANFANLFEVFKKRFSEGLENIEKHFQKLQLTELFELCHAFNPHENSNCNPDYSFVLEKLQDLDLGIKTIDDKIKVKNKFDQIIGSNENIFNTLELAFKLKLLKKSDSYISYKERMDKKLDQLNYDVDYQQFKALYLSGKNTLPRIKNDLSIDQYEFDELKKSYKDEKFIKELKSEKISFQEVMNYFNYQNEYSDYMTMHKTKGSGIENVLVVLDEYFWNQYDFKSLFNVQQHSNAKRTEKTQKLFYVACSRAIKNLKIVRMISGDEELKEIENLFKNQIQDDSVKITYCDV